MQRIQCILCGNKSESEAINFPMPGFSVPLPQSGHKVKSGHKKENESATRRNLHFFLSCPTAQKSNEFCKKKLCGSRTRHKKKHLSPLLFCESRVNGRITNKISFPAGHSGLKEKRRKRKETDILLYSYTFLAQISVPFISFSFRSQE